jgi:hypothetical protein
LELQIRKSKCKKKKKKTYLSEKSIPAQKHPIQSSRVHFLDTKLLEAGSTPLPFQDIFLFFFFFFFPFLFLFTQSRKTKLNKNPFEIPSQLA